MDKYCNRLLNLLLSSNNPSWINLYLLIYLDYTSKFVGEIWIAVERTHHETKRVVDDVEK